MAVRPRGVEFENEAFHFKGVFAIGTRSNIVTWPEGTICALAP